MPAMLFAGVLIVALLWPLALPGQLALRDMLVLDSPALNPSALGFGDLPARNVPQDGLLAVVGLIFPASWFARFLILGAAIAGSAGAVWLARLVAGKPVSTISTLAAIAVVLWNPFVLERLLQGQWSLVIAGWLLPLIAAAGLGRRVKVMWLTMWVASLTPTGALFALATGLSIARGHRWGTLLVGLLGCLPWVVPGILNAAASTSSTESVSAFAPRAEGMVGTLGSLVGLGGIWNADAVPASRELGFALAGVLLFGLLLLGVRRVPRPLLILGGLGLGLAILSWLLPDVLAWAVSTIPGAGLLRDASKLVILALPAYAAMAASLHLERPWGRWLSAAVLLLALLQVPDAPRAVALLSPVAQLEVNQELVELAQGRDVLFVDEPPLMLRDDGAPILNPLTKSLSTVESGALVVDGQVVDQPSLRWVQAHEAWQDRDLTALEDLGVGVIVDDGAITETTAPPAPLWPGLMLLVSWLLIPLGVVLARQQAR